MLRSLPQPDATKGVELAGRPLKAILLNPLLDATWDTAVQNHPDATIFHSTAWARVLVDTYGHLLDLTIGTEAIMSKFSSSVQRAVRKAQRSGLSVTIQTGLSAMTAFYKLHVRTRRRHGVPPQPRSFFTNIQQHLLSTGYGFIVLVERQKCPVAAAMFLKLGGRAVYKFGASDERQQELRANNLAMCEGIKYLAESGAETLHFGRTDKDNEGLRRFKLSWGTTEEEIRYARFETPSDSWKNSRDRNRTFYKRVFRALPASLNRVAGAIIYPHLD